ncbi:hypothetical protein CACET_c13950 [Clostridium aceticum]|uniref:Uncharacterized protein n=1 Tax=Clostridium aceticum TaxID=84022 RepID=A0A0D8IBW9_9CLOT|nr:DUF1292 domain-containing protein [Clostridium aceticum]AKL94860.1 hypothetical protein CACET_c13950 [Clostridium aceticum]KJF27788.1 hypothetical protein TZ02_04085 [Clostridium aceticum]
MGNCLNNCGCNDSSNKHLQHKKIYLTLADHTEVTCDVLDIFEVSGQNYIAVLPENSETALLYRLIENEGNPELSNIESDEEYELASKTFLAGIQQDMQ